jgi:4-amino-4-deoxy-L-arabinose transferase-like glycosyltransferase
MSFSTGARGHAAPASTLQTLLSSPRILLYCLLAGILARLAVILLIPVDPVSDANWYFTRARELSEGLGYQERGHPTAYWPVGYPAFLAGLFSVFGANVLVGQAANVALWTGSLILLHDLVRRVSGRYAPANLAVILCSLHLNSIGYSALLLTETLYTFLLILCCWSGVAIAGWRAAVATGLLLGLMTLVKAQTWLFGLAWAGAIVILGPGSSLLKRVPKAALMVALMFAVVLPWSLRNQQVFGSFVLVSTNGGLSFAVGNHPNSNGTDDWKSNPYRAQINQSVADQIGADRRAKEITWRWIRENPLDFLKLAPKKFYWAVLPDGESEWGFQSGYRHYDQYRLAFRTARWVNQAIYLAILCATLAGLVLLFARRSLFADWSRSLLLFTVAYLAMFSAVTFMFNGQSRYHFPLVPLMCAWIALAWHQLRSIATDSPPPGVRA